MFFLNSRLRYEDVADGTAHTLFVGEKFVGSDPDLGWLSGTRATLRNTGHSLRMTDRTWPEPKVIPSDLREMADDLESEEWTEQADSDGPPEVDEEDKGGRDSPDEELAPQPRAETDDPLFVGGFGSQHVGGAVFAFGDGKVEFISLSIDQVVYQQMGNRADGAPLSR
jgi:hypothetical protein